jgi:hypothetical protein
MTSEQLGAGTHGTELPAPSNGNARAATNISMQHAEHGCTGNHPEQVYVLTLPATRHLAVTLDSQHVLLV